MKQIATSFVNDVLPTRPATVSGGRMLPSALTVLLVALAIDALFVVLHLGYIFVQWPQDPRFWLEWDRGFSEAYQYAKTAAAGVVLCILAVSERASVLAIWAAVLVYIVLDDSLEFHERAGDAFEQWVGTGMILDTIRTEDVGQLLFAAAIGAVFVPCLLYTHFRAVRSARRISRGLFVLGVAFVICSVGADFLHAVLKTYTPEQPWVLLEDGGELVVMSFTLAYTWWWLLAPRERDRADGRYRGMERRSVRESSPAVPRS